MRKYRWVYMVLALCAFMLAGCGKKQDTESEALCGQIIAELGDEEQFSWRDIGEENFVLFTTDRTYDDGNGHNAAVYCDVYYAVDGEVYPLGRIESMGTAYPVSHGDKCIYTASEHSVEVYEFDGKRKEWVTSRYEEVFDENGEASYRCTREEETEEISEKDYLKVVEEYGGGTVVNFGYGASDNPF